MIRARLALVSLAAASLLAHSARAQTAPSSPAPPVPSAPAGTGDVEEARKHYARGLELYEQRADAAALAELERAFQLAPNWKVLYELGVVELALHDFASALEHFQAYLDQGKDAVPSARRQEVTTRIAELRQEVATLVVTAPDGAAIKVDDVEVATAPLAKPLLVNPGRHKVGATKDGLAAESRAISVAGGDLLRIELVIAPPLPPPALLLPPVIAPSPPAPVPPTAPSSLHEEIASTTPFPLWAGWLATGLLAIGAVATGVEALAENASLTSAKNAGPSTAAALDSYSSKAHAFAAASDVMTGAAVIAGSVTFYFTLKPAPVPSLSSPPPKAPRAPSASIAVGLGTVSIAGRF